jgi:hypothetical protein
MEALQLDSSNQQQLPWKRYNWICQISNNCATEALHLDLPDQQQLPHGSATPGFARSATNAP